MKKYIVAPSILSANFLQLQEEINLIKKSGIKWIHFDVMDGDFVQNLTFGPKILNDITKDDSLYLDCHLMVRIKNKSVEEYLKPFIEAKASSITLHYEALTEVQLVEFLSLKNKYAINLGIAIKPTTPVEDILPLLEKIDLILVMTVEPGFGGQTFISSAAVKINEIRNYINQHRLSTLIEVDGGINQETGEICKKYGVDILVAGSYLFGQNNIADRIKGLLNNA